MEFNMSASSYNTFKKSPREFYYKYIEKSLPDTETVQCYGLAGTLVHDFIENDNNDYDDFVEAWGKNNLHLLYGLNGRPLDREQYWGCVLRGLEYKQKFRVLEQEEKFLIKMDGELLRDDNIYLKGFVDLQGIDGNGNYVVVDWKTSSKASDSHVDQACFYMYLMRLKYGHIPARTHFVYLKNNEVVDKDYTNIETDPYRDSDGEWVNPQVLNLYSDFINELHYAISQIKEWGHDKSMYPLGDWDHIFNEHKKKCARDAQEELS